MNENIYFQPDFKNDDTLITPDGVELCSYHVYANFDNARKDFPDRQIIAYKGCDIENPYFIDGIIIMHEKSNEANGLLAKTLVSKLQERLKLFPDEDDAGLYDRGLYDGYLNSLKIITDEFESIFANN